MITEAATDGSEERCAEASQLTVYVLMSENADGVAGMVCATRPRAEDELRRILSEHVTYDDGAPHPSHTPDAIDKLVEESRHASISPHQDDRYWIDVCPVHT